MDKLRMKISELLEFNGLNVDVFSHTDKQFLRCKCPQCEKGKSPALSIHRSLGFAVCFRCGVMYINQGMIYEEIRDSLISLNEPSKASLLGVAKTPNRMIEMMYTEVPKEGTPYLTGRNPLVGDWRVYGLMYDETSIYIPYYYFNELIYYQIRYTDGNPQRYNMPSLPSPIYIPSRSWDMMKPTIICEGPFDAIAIHSATNDFNVVGLVGKEVTSYKKRLLSNLSTPHYYLMLDKTQLSAKLKKDLSRYYDVSIIPMDGRDPEELLADLGQNEFVEYINSFLI